MLVYDLLKLDHEKVKTLFTKLEATTEKQVEKRTQIFETLMEELSVHASAEEKFFYPALEDKVVTEDLTMEALEEHRLVKKLLKELDTNEKSTKAWGAKLTVLHEVVEHHVSEEEGELFKKAKKVLDDEEAKKIGQQIENFKDKKKLQPVV